MKRYPKNKFDNKDALDIGSQAEAIFVQLASQRGWTIQAANKEQDINEHWDYELSSSENSYKIDVKSRKRINRKDDTLQDEWTWLEIHGVRPHDQGWLFGGKSDFIAFEREHDFVLVATEMLRAFVKTKVAKKWVESPSDAHYKLYQRNNRHDILTLVQLSEIANIAWEIWQK